MRTVVFAGPSIDPVKAAPFGVEMAPPAVRGDIDRLLASKEPPAVIGIVDGGFLQGLMLSPKEVLRAMDQHQVTVFGSSSVGALRAAELDRYGMKGIGRVYEMYRCGEVEDDDEVAMTFDPDTLRPLCEPMVNIRIALHAASERGVISPEVAMAATAVAKALYFPERSYARMVRELSAQRPGEDFSHLLTFLTHDAPNAKENDALALLGAVRSAVSS